MKNPYDTTFVLTTLWFLISKSDPQSCTAQDLFTSFCFSQCLVYKSVRTLPSSRRKLIPRLLVASARSTIRRSKYDKLFYLVDFEASIKPLGYALAISTSSKSSREKTSAIQRARIACVRIASIWRSIFANCITSAREGYCLSLQPFARVSNTSFIIYVIRLL